VGGRPSPGSHSPVRQPRTRVAWLTRSVQPAPILLSLSVAVGLLALVLIATSLVDWRDLAPVYRPVSFALAAAALVVIALGWLAPPPWLHILVLILVLSAVWSFGILTWFAFTNPEQALRAEAGPGPGAVDPLCRSGTPATPGVRQVCRLRRGRRFLRTCRTWQRSGRCCFQHDVEGGFGHSSERCEPGAGDDVAQPSLAGLCAQGGSDILCE